MMVILHETKMDVLMTYYHFHISIKHWEDAAGVVVLKILKSAM